MHVRRQTSWPITRGPCACSATMDQRNHPQCSVTPAIAILR